MTPASVAGAQVDADGRLKPFVISDGINGWTPILAGDADGTRSLLKVVDWTGGNGSKPAAGMYIGSTGYVSAKAQAFNFNLAKRVAAFSAVTKADGIATVAFSGYAAAPTAVVIGAIPAILNGSLKAEIVADSVSKIGCQVKVTAAALLTGIVTALAGATVTVLTIEA